MGKKKLTVNQKAWQKEINRLNRYINQGIKQGFKFNLQQYNYSTEIPTRVTKKMVEKLKAIKPRHLYSESTYINPDTLKEVSGLEAKKRIDKQKRERKARQKAVREHKFINNNFDYDVLSLQKVRGLIDSWQPQTNWSEFWTNKKDDDRNILNSMLERRINLVGEEAVAKSLDEYTGSLESVVDTILYHSNQQEINSAFNVLAEILVGRSLTQRESEDVTIFGDVM